MRAGNVIGGGDWSKDRLIPDAVRAWRDGGTLRIRRPDAVRPWQHVLEPANAYLVLAERLWKDPSLAGAFNIGPASGEMASVRTVVNLAQCCYGKGQTEFGAEVTGPHEAGLLALETAKARAVLGVVPRWDLNLSVERTMQWYKSFDGGVPAAELCTGDIAAFEAAP